MLHDTNVFLEISCLQMVQSDEGTLKELHLKTREEGGVNKEVLGYLILSKSNKKSSGEGSRSTGNSAPAWPI